MKKRQLKLDEKLLHYTAIGAAFTAINPNISDAAIIYHDPADVTAEATAVSGNIVGIGMTSGNLVVVNSFAQIGNPNDFQVAFRPYIENIAGTLSIQGFAYGGLLTMDINGNDNVARLATNVSVGAAGNFQPTEDLMDYYNSGYEQTAWTPSGLTGFIGVSFRVGGNTHYGWIRATVNYVLPGLPNPVAEITIHDFAYEDCPDTSILTGAQTSANPSCSTTITPGAASVPTIGEWGLITLCLFLLSFGTIFIGRREGALNTGGSVDLNNPIDWAFQRPPFYPSLFKNALLGTSIIAAMIGVFSLIAYGGITVVDFFGTLVAGTLFAYLMHLVIAYEREIKNRAN